MFEQAELRGTPMGPTGPPNAKATAKFAPEIAILGTLAFLVILVFFGKTSNFGHWPAISELERTSSKKAHAGGCSDQSD